MVTNLVLGSLGRKQKNAASHMDDKMDDKSRLMTCMGPTLFQKEP